MKKSRIITLLGTLTLALGGLVAFSQVSKKGNFEEAKAATLTTVYYAISEKDRNNYTLKLNVNFKGDGADWHTYDMERAGKMTDGTPLWKGTFTDAFDGLGNLQFQWYNGSTWVYQDQPISSWTSASTYNGKCFVHGKTGWVNPFSKGRYVVGSFNSWGIENAVYLELKDSQYEGTVDLSYGDEFKVAYFNGTSLESYYGYSSCIGGGLFCFSGESNDNFKTWATGKYNLYFRDVEYEAGKKISVEIVGVKWNAEQLAAKVMSLGEYPEHCGDSGRFPLCKEKFLAMDSTEQGKFEDYGTSEIKQFQDAYNRYTAWARALGEKPFENGKISSPVLNVINLNKDNNTGIIVIVIATAISLTAVAGFFFFRKRKHI